MNRDDAIKAVAEHFRIVFGGPVEPWMGHARVLAATGLLAIDPEPEPEPEPLPVEPLAVGTRKRSPGGAEVILTDDGDSYPWTVYKGGAGETTDDYLSHKNVADWEVITDVPEGHVTIDLSGLPIGHVRAFAAGRGDYPLINAYRAEAARRGESA